MFRSLAKKWENFQFEAMIKHRVELTRKMLREHGAPTEPEVHAICEMYAKELVKRNLGSLEESTIKEATEKVKQARAEIQRLFETDGYKKDFAFALSHVCVGWDMDAYKKNRKNNNLTLNCLLKNHTEYAGLFTEKMLFGKKA